MKKIHRLVWLAKAPHDKTNYTPLSIIPILCNSLRATHMSFHPIFLIRFDMLKI